MQTYSHTDLEYLGSLRYRNSNNQHICWESIPAEIDCILLWEDVSPAFYNLKDRLIYVFHEGLQLNSLRGISESELIEEFLSQQDGYEWRPQGFKDHAYYRVKYRTEKYIGLHLRAGIFNLIDPFDLRDVILIHHTDSRLEVGSQVRL